MGKSSKRNRLSKPNGSPGYLNCESENKMDIDFVKTSNDAEHIEESMDAGPDSPINRETNRLKRKADSGINSVKSDLLTDTNPGHAELLRLIENKQIQEDEQIRDVGNDTSLTELISFHETYEIQPRKDRNGKDSNPRQSCHWADRAILIDPLIQSQPFPDEILPDLRKALAEEGITSLFPTQSAVIPLLLRNRRRDLCCCASTGSGKTLAYSIPIIQNLYGRKITRLRALIVLPTRDLAIQVHQVMSPLAQKLGLSVGLSIGQVNFRQEQEMLLGKAPYLDCFKKSGRSTVDILVATTGRLIDHIEGSRNEGFTLQHLEYLVVDEADKLLNQSYQDWVSKLFDAVYNSHQGVAQDSQWGKNYDPTTCRIRNLPLGSLISQYRPPFQKLLFSATLTTDPRQLAALGLKNPLFLTASSEKLFRLPPTLKEHMVICEGHLKPLTLFYLMRKVLENNSKQVLIFTVSVESAHRLALFLKLFDSSLRIREFSSSLSQSERTQAIEKFRSKDINIIICSDAMARGLDFKNVDIIINYDSPPYAQTYVHRVGRTARAGASGEAFTLIRKDQAFHFRRMTKKIEGSNAVSLKLGSDWDSFALAESHRYENCLAQVQETLHSEEQSRKQRARRPR